jgi:peptidoglycan hydrolase-like protein with peptidoglycan-binding domain
MRSLIVTGTLISTLVFLFALCQTVRASAGGTASPTSVTTKKAPAASTHGVSISNARCVPVNNCDTNAHEVSISGRLLMTGSGLKSGMVVAFPRTAGARIASSSPKAHLHNSSLGLVVAVPSSAHSGHIEILLSAGRHSNSYGPIHVARHPLHPPVKPVVPAPAASTTASGTAFDGQGMWIWYVNQSDGGSVASIVAQAKAADVTTLFIKSSDGSTNYWSQFSPQLVAELHANGLKVCAWQYVYGTNPVGEANLGAEAVTNGADCLVIDAEAEYEGHYSAAQTYITELRAKIGESYPVGLASFPYVDYHESFPYSVFLGPGGAQFNAPQMYWHDIGTSVENVFSHTYEENLVYGRPIMPLGQTYGGVSASEILSFRSLASAYGAQGSSFWDWQETTSTGWSTLAGALTSGVTIPQPELTSPLLKQGAKGDQVLWMQEHLASAIPTQETTGVFGSQTTTDLESFQTAHGIPATGETDPTTWADLLALQPVAVDWKSAGPSGA